ncbi:hypothetical protein M501DRAFT_943340, partial [Patellaria atrata CBS 101060]
MPHKQLHAATRHLELKSRNNDIKLCHTAELVYAESENSKYRGSTFTSRVKAVSDTPILVLEENEHLLTDISCVRSTIRLGVTSWTRHVETVKACSQPEGCLVVTSHIGCNDDGERGLYRVQGINYRKADSTVILNVERVSWKKSFRSFNIDFGYTENEHILRHHFPQIDTRQALPPVNPESIDPSTFPLPTDTPEADSATVDLSFQVLDIDFVPSILGDIPFEIGCKNCTTSGSVTLSSGEFDITPEFSFGNLDQGIDFIQGGFVELTVDSFAARIELEASPVASVAFAQELIVLPIVGFVIPGIGQAGITFAPQISGSFELDGCIDITYGFELEVPDGSSVRLDLADLSNSGTTGFENTRLASLPFDADFGIDSLTLTTAFQPRIPVGFSFLDDALVAEVAVVVDLPSFAVTLTPLTGVDDQCQPLAGAEEATENLGTGTNLKIEPALAINLAVEAELAAVIPGLPDAAFATAVTLLSTTFALPTACVPI